MAFTPVCATSAIQKGGMGLFQVGKKSVLLVWPVDGEIKAYRGRCPHADMPLTDAEFDGTTVTCAVHRWGFDADSGKCMTHINVSNRLHPFALRIDGGEIHVDLGPARVSRALA
jgi:toluene monooxygenase system ferredoxin subunit